MPSNHLILSCPLLLLPSIFPIFDNISPHSLVASFWNAYYLKFRFHYLLLLLPLLLSRFSRVRLCATPWMAAHQRLLAGVGAGFPVVVSEVDTEAENDGP